MAKQEAQAHAREPQPLIILVEYTRQLAPRPKAARRG
jgi:hypothetical protein